jgi:hypothetical protein
MYYLLFEVKKHMPNVIKTIVKCYKGFCGIYCQINSYVCAGLTSNHWHKEFIPGNTSLKMTPDDLLRYTSKYCSCFRCLMTDDPGVNAAPKALVRSKVELPNL